MAVENRYVVVRGNKGEVATFMDKKEADAYDRMLDMAEAMQDILQQADTGLGDDAVEALGIFLAERREDVLVALQAKRAPVSKKAKPENSKPKAVDAA